MVVTSRERAEGQRARRAALTRSVRRLARMPSRLPAWRAGRDRVRTEQPRVAVGLDQPRGNLPLALTSFVGRDHELTMVRRLLIDDGVRLLTLVGPGGSGKTRLALHAAEQLAAVYPDGVWLVELAAVLEPNLVPQAVAVALGVHEETERPLLATLTATLQTQRLLLVLDNCEHLAGACAALATSLLTACPGLTILATSRAALGVTGETLRSVVSLGLPVAEQSPTVEVVAASEAARLFIARAATVQPDFELTPETAPLVAQVCCHLDGIPLALELAAARLRVLTLSQIVARLDDGFGLLTGGSRTALPRQRTLRAAIDWSHDLLTEAERVVLRRLAVFVGGWTLPAAEAVGRLSDDEMVDTLESLTSLVDQSLVQVEKHGGEARYRLLETVRQYALERLRAAGEETTVRERHGAWCLALVESVAPQLTGPAQADSLARLAVEHDNLRAALTWALESGRAEIGLRLAGNMWRFWFTRGCLSEGRQWLEASLARGDEAPAATRARALSGAGWLARRQGDLVSAVAWYETSLSLCRIVGDRPAIAEALNDLAMTLCERRDYARAAALHEESLALCRELEDRRGIAVALTNLARVLNDRGDYARAVALHEEALKLFRELGDAANVAYVLENLAIPVSELGDQDRSVALLEECLVLRQALGDQAGVAMVLLNLGRVTYCQGEYARAEALLEESLALRRMLGLTRRLATPLLRLGMTVRAQGDLARAAALFRECLGLFAAAGDSRGMANGLEEMAILVANDQPRRAVRWLGAAAELREALGAPREQIDRAVLDRTVAEVRVALGEAEFAAGWIEGRALMPPRAVAEVLDVARPSALRLVPSMEFTPAIPGDTPGPLAASPIVPPQTAPMVATASPAEADGLDRLTPRELAVLRLIGAGRSGQEIAAELALSVRTVERHITNLYGKLSLRNRAEATIFVLRNGLV